MRLALLLVLVSGAAAGKPWNGILPGGSSQLDVIGKFGEPSKRTTSGATEILVYWKEKAIKGTTQAQFRIDASKTVQRIDIYPSVVLDMDVIERTYGPECAKRPGADPCYARRESETRRLYFTYAKLGLAVFFQDDGRTVHSMAFLPSKG